jgi:hypothetical protein
MKTSVEESRNTDLVTIDELTGEHYTGPILVKLIDAGASGVDYMETSYGIVTSYALLIFYKDGDTREWPTDHPLIQYFKFRVLSTGSTITMEQS